MKYQTQLAFLPLKYNLISGCPGKVICIIGWEPNQVAQAVQLLQDGTSILYVQYRHIMICFVSQHSLKITEDTLVDQLLHQESWTGPQKGNSPAAGRVSAPLLKEKQEKHCESPLK